MTFGAWVGGTATVVVQSLGLEENRPTLLMWQNDVCAIGRPYTLTPIVGCCGSVGATYVVVGGTTAVWEASGVAGSVEYGVDCTPYGDQYGWAPYRPVHWGVVVPSCGRVLDLVHDLGC